MEQCKTLPEKKLRQWHPAFYAGTQIEFQEEATNLIFENEHQLGTKPMEIDILIIKKESGKPIQKNIGKIFRKYNVVEYKSPSDYMSIDDFYKVYGYACFYKADSNIVDDISIKEMTISLVCEGYPRKLIEHLEHVRGFLIKKEETGIYYVYGDIMPIQIITTKYLSPEKNLWLRSLTDSLADKAIVQKLIKEYEKNRENTLYSSMMNVIVQANEAEFVEVKENMCEALKALMQDEIDAAVEEGIRKGIEEAVEKAVEEAVEKAVEEAVEKAVEEAVEERAESQRKQMNALNLKLIELGRIEDVVKAAKDDAYQRKLLAEFNIDAAGITNLQK